MEEDIWQYRAYDEYKMRYLRSRHDFDPEYESGRVIQNLSVIKKIMENSSDPVVKKYAIDLETCEISYRALYDIHFGQK